MRVLARISLYGIGALVYARGVYLSKILSQWIVECGLITAGMISVVIIIVMAHFPTKSQFVAEFDALGLRASFDPINPAEPKGQDEDHRCALEQAWDE
jgi:hypothetical protein